MQQSKKARNSIIFGSIFGLIAVLFALLNYFHVIKTLDLFLAVTYVSYFVGLALFYLGAYCKEKNYKNARILSNLAAVGFTIVAIALLIYGFTTGQISMFG